MDRKTYVWWSFLRGVSVLNLGLLAGVVLSVDTTLPYRQAHILLATIYVLVCGFRSFYPRIDLERTVLVKHWLSNIVLGRACATVAEMSLTGQLALVLMEVSELHEGYTGLYVMAWIIVPMIALAQTLCWYQHRAVTCTIHRTGRCGVLSGNHLWHAGEESLWVVLALLLGAACVMVWPLATGSASYIALGALLT